MANSNKWWGTTILRSKLIMSNDDLPFVRGGRYRVLTDLIELGHAFKAGSTVEFLNSSYDPHNGLTRFWFKNDCTDELNAWHVWDVGPPASALSKVIFQGVYHEPASKPIDQPQ